MGSSDIPPPGVPDYVVPVSGHMLSVGGMLWTASYLLYARESLRTKSYGMPLVPLAVNIGWEAVNAFYVAEAVLERIVITSWCFIDVSLFYGVVRYGPREWERGGGGGGGSTWVSRNLVRTFGLMVLLSLWANWAFAHWWIRNEINPREGKFYGGRLAADTTEMGYWTAAFAQILISTASLAQLLVREHSGGVSWSIWATRFAGSLTGLWAAYLWLWYHWPEGHPYVVSEVSLFFMIVSIACDVAYAPVLWSVRRTEKILPDGSKVAPNYVEPAKKSKAL